MMHEKGDMTQNRDAKLSQSRPGRPTVSLLYFPV
jgi:hypothetical protein